MSLAIIFSPIALGKIVVKNRITMAPMGTNLQAWDGSVNEALIAYLEARAKGGVGLIISPFADVNDEQRQFSFGVYSDRLRPGLNRLAEAIQAYGAKFFLQIAHYGGKANKEVTGRTPVAPSGISSPLYKYTPRELTKEEIAALVEQFGQAARRAKLAGCDGVELHGAHTYLVGQFISPHTNKRKDRYGGSFEGRMRFVDEIMESIRGTCGNDYPVGFKFSAHEHLEGGVDDELAQRIAKHMEELGAIYLHVASTSSTISSYVECDYPSVPSIYTEAGVLVKLAEKVKRSGVKIPVIATGGINDPKHAERILKEGKADMVALGRALLADPAWVTKAKRGGSITPCIRCNICHTRDVLQRKEIRCTVNPILSRERQYRIEKADSLKKVIIVGAGPSGLESGLVAAKRGHKIILYEAKEEIGGQMRLGCIPIFKKEVYELLEYYRQQIKKSSVELKVGVEATPRILQEEDPDVVILAIGAEPILPDVPGIGSKRVVTVVKLYENIEEIGSGEKIVVLGAGLVGSEAAWFLSLRGNSVKLVDILPLEGILAGEHPTNRSALLKGLRSGGVQILDRRTITRIEDDTVILKTDDGAEESHPFDKLVIAIGLRPRTALKEALQFQLSCDIYEIGDCVAPRNLYYAIHEGAHLARQI